MPAGKIGVQTLKHYGAVSDVGSNTVNSSKRVAPLNPNRTHLTLQNTGANPGVLRFSEPVRGDGSDILINTAQILVFDQADTCPVEAINLGSALGTTWAIVEGTTP